MRLNAFQQKKKEEREAKRQRLDGRYEYTMQLVADCVGCERADVEDAVLDGDQVRDDVAQPVFNYQFKPFLELQRKGYAFFSNAKKEPYRVGMAN